MALKFCNYLAIAIAFYGFFFFLFLLISALYFAAFCYVLGCTITSLVYWLYMFEKEDLPFQYLKKKKYSTPRDDRLIQNMGKNYKFKSKCKMYEDVENNCTSLENLRWLPYCGKKSMCTNTEKQKDIDSKEKDRLLNPTPWNSSSFENEKKTSRVKLQSTPDSTSNEGSKKNKSVKKAKKSSSKSRKFGRKNKVKKADKKTKANMKKKEDYPVTSIKHSV